ncbi:DedA family protein [Lichenicola cladoniae]|uniref:DedA family protein n=1 Tax=Lichenicola cladoniae TaxID=1484109 RepID=A0A6M8HSE5_9PROT|nr:VTT domain-containing protein [Lichenicola cladoniae]NPD65862.1 DedA family protein [Acetobacteraceae bacterium]QKE91137.1 DedA family protein [Lichenicola cladoniae]
MLKRLYARILALSATPAAPFWLAAIAVAEGSFFPVPPDLLLIPMVLARRDRAWVLAAICTLASLCGGAIGWVIGAEMIQLATRLIHFYHAEHALEVYRLRFAQYGFYVILLKGLTPIPYKIIAIAAGAAHYSLPLFLLASLITRGFRFFLVAGLLRQFGAPIQDFIERRLTLLALAFAVLIVVGVLVALRV